VLPRARSVACGTSSIGVRRFDARCFDAARISASPRPAAGAMCDPTSCDTFQPCGSPAAERTAPSRVSPGRRCHRQVKIPQFAPIENSSVRPIENSPVAPTENSPGAERIVSMPRTRTQGFVLRCVWCCLARVRGRVSFISSPLFRRVSPALDPGSPSTSFPVLRLSAARDASSHPLLSSPPLRQSVA
jgi:hypothetical protein